MKTVIVTGALRGIGLSVLKLLSQEGFRVIAVANSSYDMKEKIVSGLTHVEVYKVDLSSREMVLDFCHQMESETIFALVNVAGIAQGDNLESFSIESWDKTMETNLTAPMLLATNLFNRIEENGSIVNIASLYGSLYGMSMSLSYSASKAALVNLTKSLAYQLMNKRIRVNAIAPSIVNTDMTSQDTKEMIEQVSKRTAVGRIAQPEEIANIVSFLISKKASYINGHIIVADGGYSCWDGIY